MGRDGWSERIQWNKHGNCFCCELPVISQLLEFDSGGTIERLLITVVGALREQQNSAVLTLHTNSACRQCVRSDLLNVGCRWCIVVFFFWHSCTYLFWQWRQRLTEKTERGRVDIQHRVWPGSKQLLELTLTSCTHFTRWSTCAPWMVQCSLDWTQVHPQRFNVQEVTV